MGEFSRVSWRKRRLNDRRLSERDERRFLLTVGDVCEAETGD